MLAFRRVFLIAVIALLWAGCQVELTEDGEPERRPIGKADLIGSCAESDCDGPAPVGNCYCDEDCAFFGDCCADRGEVCEPEPEPPSCESAGGTCLSSPIDETHAARCGEELGLDPLEGSCAVVNEACCAVAADELEIADGVVDRVVDGRHVIILIQKDGRVVDEVLVPASDYPTLGERDRVVVVRVRGEVTNVL